jgi:hypothetical protein
MVLKDRLNNGRDKRRPSSPAEDRPPEVEDFLAKVQTEASRPRFPINAANWRQVAPPATREGTLGKPTSDIAEAVENLKEAVTGLSVASGPPQYSSRNPVPFSTAAPKRDAYTETIDSREAARRYGNLNGSSRPEKAGGQTFTATIDSREAAKKYGGANID